MAPLGCEWALPLLRRAYEQPGAERLSLPGRLALVSRARATEPDRPRSPGADATSGGSLAASGADPSSISPAPHGRHYLRQEPDAETRQSGSVEGVMGNHDSYSDLGWGG